MVSLFDLWRSALTYTIQFKFYACSVCVYGVVRVFSFYLVTTPACFILQVTDVAESFSYQLNENGNCAGDAVSKALLSADTG